MQSAAAAERRLPFPGACGGVFIRGVKVKPHGIMLQPKTREAEPLS
jgi:hypothetical protein